ncbi:MAG TPA: reverse transcriptase domain-containing protein, partial [Candidatus Binatia bacterium]|nr:reverse transcriptase domain-containing protein [Candidatus Binatia bacterium]
LCEILRQRVNDGRILRLIGKWLRAGVMEEWELSHPETGVVQGGVISPVLAKIFLHDVLDEWFAREVRPRRKGRCFLLRFADDFVRHEARCVHGARHLPPTVGRQVYPPSLQAEQLAGQGTPGETTGSTGIVANP